MYAYIDLHVFRCVNLWLYRSLIIKNLYYSTLETRELLKYTHLFPVARVLAYLYPRSVI